MKKQFLSVAMALFLLLSMTAMAAPSGSYDQQIQQAVTQKIDKTKQLKGVTASVEDGIVTLSGSVNLYQDKLDATKKIKKLAHVSGVRNQIEVAGATVADAELQKKLAKTVTYDRVGYFDNTFNFINVSVKDGVVTLTGAAYWDPPMTDAMNLAARTPGVKDVVNDVKVLPTSRMDDSIRVRTARAIYGDSVLGRYGTDPAKPIRIVVDNGHVTLYGSVERAMDKQIAGVRASGVSGAFSVNNQLVVD